MEQLRNEFIRLGLINNNYKRGDIFYADLGEKDGSEQAGIRPVIIIQNDIGNKYSPTVIVASITSQRKNSLPVHVDLRNEELEKDSTILLEQIRTLDKRKLIERIGSLDFNTIKELNFALGKSVGLI
ncbi:type II toxin-antitoxin system PemK/MazF family toxin [Clostridium sardiniense]|uniref:mRNA interferase n=1 Tax=Clostridium sardiniense TaxID=29369 RepID=A0ABS7L0D0_CLOSR|nr:type II toxin-antitoxin system PemK/MazF family toxin [Clostridium sardiniense]MBY0756318.1 type II toxin-antitoxin system PemK/MazF family toxin [Clostridium sardiniense]MDQ0461475.1 mRNA interferase MazF [Clostridium sardiniense]